MKFRGGGDICGIGLSASEIMCIFYGNTVSIYTLAALYEDHKKGALGCNDDSS